MLCLTISEYNYKAIGSSSVVCIFLKGIVSCVSYTVFDIRANIHLLLNVLIGIEYM